MGITKKELEEIRQKKIEIDIKEAEEFWEKNKDKIVDYFDIKLIEKIENKSFNDINLKFYFSMVHNLRDDLQFKYNTKFLEVIVKHLSEEYPDMKIILLEDNIIFDLTDEVF